jgi:hypothetical protein
MNYILVIWMTVGFAGTQYSTHEKMGWVPIGDFATERACMVAGDQLNKTPAQIRCLRKY